jgi:hypothetical protein
MKPLQEKKESDYLLFETESGTSLSKWFPNIVVDLKR